jgi:hypothetical protein
MSALLVLVAALLARVSVADAGGHAADVQQRLNRLPLLFVENQGQLDRRVAYSLSGTDRTVYFTASGVTLVMHGQARQAPVKVTFPGARAGVRPEAYDPTPTRVSYWRAEAAANRTDIPTYARLVYRDLWPGIDLEYVVRERTLKYTFRVAAGADPSLIRIAYRGVRDLAHTGAGTLAIDTPGGGLVDLRPVAFQDGPGGRVEVAAEYALEANRSPGARVHGFRLAPYDRSRTLELDPATVVYAGFFAARTSGTCGMSGGIAVDGGGNAYITGNSDNRPGTFPPTDGSTYGGNTDAFVAKIAPDGTLLRAGFFGSPAFETGDAIAADPAGNVYLLGSGGNQLPNVIAPVATQSSFYIARFTVDGAVEWTRLFPGTTAYCPRGIAAVPDGSGVVATGFTATNETVFPVEGGPGLVYHGQGDQGEDAFVVRLGSSGGITFAGYIGGTKFDSGEAVAVDAGGNTYVAGFTSSTETDLFPLLEGPDATFNGDGSSLFPGDAFVAKVGPTGTLLYCGYIGGSESDIGTGIGVDASGNAYVAGVTRSYDGTFPTAVGPVLDPMLGGTTSDAPFITKVSTNGMDLVYSGFVGTSIGGDIRTKVGVDAAGGAIVLVDDVASAEGFPAGGAKATRLGANGEVLIAKVRAAGDGLEWSTLFGGGGGEFPRGIAVDAVGDAWFIGDSGSEPPGFPAAGGPSLTRTAAFNQDVFVARIHGTPGNGGGGGGGTGTCTVSATCLADVQAALPNPDLAPDLKSAKVARGLAKLLAKAGSGIDGAASATKPKKQARQLKKARRALTKLLNKATKADLKGRLNAPLATIQAAVNDVLAQL